MVDLLRPVRMSEILAWERARNASGSRVKWMFDVTRARKKLGRAYPATNASAVPCAA